MAIDTSHGRSPQKMESSSNKSTSREIFLRAIKKGVPLYNSENKKKCFQLYLRAAGNACQQEKKISTRQTLEDAIDIAETLGNAGRFGDGALALRNCFDKLLQRKSSSSSKTSSSSRTVLMDDYSNESSTIELSFRSWNNDTIGVPSDPTETERAKFLARTYGVLLQSLKPTSQATTVESPHTELHFEDCVLASDIVETLTEQLALPSDQAVHTTKLLQSVELLRSVSDPEEVTISNNRIQLYRYATESEIKEKLQELKALSHHYKATLPVHILTLERVLGINNDNSEERCPVSPPVRTTSHARLVAPAPRQLEGRGAELAALAAKLESVVEVKDRKHKLKTYPACFTGSDAVDAVIAEGLCHESRILATSLMNDLLVNGLVHHVANDHEFKDQKLFYRFTNQEKLQEEIVFTRRTSVSLRHAKLLRYVTITERAAGMERHVSVINNHSTFHAAPQHFTPPLRRPSASSTGPSDSLSQEDIKQKGEEWAAFAANVESVVEIKDRKHNFKTYPNCFLGSEAVSAVAVRSNLPRDEATAMMNALLLHGLVRHVLNEHEFEDKKLFYCFTPLLELQDEIRAAKMPASRSQRSNNSNSVSSLGFSSDLSTASAYTSQSQRSNNSNSVSSLGLSSDLSTASSAPMGIQDMIRYAAIAHRVKQLYDVEVNECSEQKICGSPIVDQGGRLADTSLFGSSALAYVLGTCAIVPVGPSD